MKNDKTNSQNFDYKNNNQTGLDKENKDKVYARPMDPIPPFEFNTAVADVFNDMAERSIPAYSEVQKMIVRLTEAFARPDSVVYDLGCSTGNTFNLLLNGNLPQELKLIGIDSSEAMCKKTRMKFSGKKQIEIICGKIEDTPIQNASVVVMNYTLQFLPVLEREKVLERIYQGMNPNGILLVSDKVRQTDKAIAQLYIDEYYRMKKEHGYSELEISQKREALENRLIPYTLDEEINLFKNAGFGAVDIFYSWYNFSSLICMKTSETSKNQER